MSDPIGPYAVTPSRPSPPTARCFCEWRKVYSGTVKAHRRTCPDWTQEDANWCAAQWVDAARRGLPIAATFGIDGQPLRVYIEPSRSRWYRFRAWLAGKIERLAGWVRP